MIPIVLGVALGVAVLGLVHQFSVFGEVCFYVGNAMPTPQQCIPPVFYYGGLGVAALLVLVGVIQMLRPKSSPNQN